MRARKVLRIARWEVTKNAGGIDRRTVAIAVGAILLIGALAPLIASQGVALDSGIYRVGVDEASPYHDVVTNESTFAVREPTLDGVEEGRLDLLIDGSRIVATADSPKGRAARSELRSATQRYNDEMMGREDNRTAAFPVSVSLNYVDRTLQTAPADGSDGTDGGQDGTDSATGGSGSDGGDGGTDPGVGEGDSVSGGGDGGGSLGGLGGLFGGLGGGGASGSPSDIAPPFPFGSLVLAFVFVLPLNFVIQAYGSTILSERINRRGELMLVSPVSRGDIITGKTLPYFLGAMAFETMITVGLLAVGPTVATGWISLLAVTPLVLLFLGATFTGAMFARSFKELTFVTVTITVALTSYAFVPAIFTDVTPIALISPLTLVVRDLQGQAISLVEFTFSTLPPFLTAVVTFGLGAGLYREEDMFTQRPIPLKVLDSLSGRIKRRTSAAKLSIILLPFVLVTELVAVAMLFAVPRSFSIPAILIAVAVIEELAKSIHLYAGFVHKKYARTVRNAIVVGSLSGLGFFIAEKLGLIVQLLGTDLPEVQQAAFATSNVPSEVSPLLVGALLLAPLALHAVTATASAIGAVYSRRGYVVGITVAILIHLAYNLTVVTVFVG
ncbi:PrsW family glutamic-type intramembrane protease [Halorhabdus amylolytica]|uniref:PrsW family glutamic-type intramembrane protease n=1 Tax=Halorhabdus amylolytica TaxID=2559573 RepID=UPI0010AAE6BF|nr:PrsW family glutamic-type intramembrane protease [Halorhabdus amylolytica]